MDDLGDFEAHESGELFLEFCIENRLNSLATWFEHRWHHRATHYNNNGETVRVYDFILTADWLRKFTTDCRVRNNVSIDSDHRCLVAVHAVPRFKRDRKMTGKRSKRPKKRAPKYDFGTLRKDEHLENNFIQNFVDNIDNFQDPGGGSTPKIFTL